MVSKDGSGGVRSNNRKRICPDLRDLNSLNCFCAEQGGRIVLWRSNGGKNQDNVLRLHADPFQCCCSAPAQAKKAFLSVFRKERCLSSSVATAVSPALANGQGPAPGACSLDQVCELSPCTPTNISTRFNTGPDSKGRKRHPFFALVVNLTPGRKSFCASS